VDIGDAFVPIQTSVNAKTSIERYVSVKIDKNASVEQRQRESVCASIRTTVHVVSRDWLVFALTKIIASVDTKKSISEAEERRETIIA